jgi:hypothetical protein
MPVSHPQGMAIAFKVTKHRFPRVYGVDRRGHDACHALTCGVGAQRGSQERGGVHHGGGGRV